ncbi:uncharacterized protein LOC110068793 [Orbicella faveolata]|uniref:uncharacterized protein LOC110068793 n=1 Tax=Orbicella faveolata TaxID=48498 RepID=UPI0009E6372C|nr:uncharacterized protein LOC110068793 [Orbicella faveolata]
MAKRRPNSQCQVIPHDHFGDDSPVLLSIPQMQKPFDYGWQREIIYRHIGSGRNSDVIYITPCGKKLNCRADVEKYLRAEKICYLSPDWFSFDSHVLVGGGDREVSRAISVIATQEPWRKSKWSTLVICTRYCPNRNNARPSLQCTNCKNFFHPECVFLSTPTEIKKHKDNYICTVSYNSFKLYIYL